MCTLQQLTGIDHSHLIRIIITTKEFFVHHNVAPDLLQLQSAANLAGFDFAIASGYRDFAKQLAIWNGKFSGDLIINDVNSKPLDKTKLTDSERMFAILHWSALPSASRHHWGSDFDVYAYNLIPKNQKLNLIPDEYESGNQQEFYLWMQANLAQFNFFFPYQQYLGGVAAEPWHISHKPTADMCLQLLDHATFKKQLQLLAHKYPIDGIELILANLDLIYSKFIKI